MKPKKLLDRLYVSAAATALTAAGFAAEVDEFLTLSDKFTFSQPNTYLTISESKERPEIIRGIPELNDGEELSLTIFKAGFINHGMKIINAVVIGADPEAASAKATLFRNELDRQLALTDRPFNGGWKMHVREDPISSIELIELAQESEIFYTIA